jgi:nucleoside-triphosphatase
LKRLLLITGNPGVGKTTVLLKTIESLKAKGYSVGGMISREVRTHGTRVGFEISDLESGTRGWLARVDQEYGPRVGKYRVNLKDLDNVGAAAIIKAVKTAGVVAIDEAGPMELNSQKFKEAVKAAVESEKLVVATVHWRATDKLIVDTKAREDAETFQVTYGNRAKTHKIIFEKATRFLATSAEK